MPSPLNVQLPQYEGPLDLLLDLIRKQEIDIHDIPIARITAQYMEYMEQAATYDVDLSAEFIYMAATLIHIKSKMLLPRDPELEKLAPEEDPRKELVDRLLEHERFKTAAEMLQQKRMIEEAAWSNPGIERFLPGDEEPALAVTLFDLVRTFQQVLERARERPVYEVSDDDASVPDMIRYLRVALQAAGRGETISVVDLFERQRSRRAMICLFLAILEMVKLQAITLVQRDAFGDIGLRKHSGFDRLTDAGPALVAIEEGYR